MTPAGFLFASNVNALDSLYAVGVEVYVNRQLARDAAIASGLEEFVTAQVIERVELEDRELRVERIFRVEHHCYDPASRVVR